MIGFFRREAGGALVPAPAAHSPWGEHMLHGRLLAALAARAVEQDAGAPAMRPVRLTVDLFRAAPMEPVEIATEVVRAGRRVRAAEVVITCAGHEVVRATALLLREGSQPAGEVWGPEPWSVPAPEGLSPMAADPDQGGFLDVRIVSEGGFTAVVQKRLWIREVRPLVEGEVPSPFVRAVAAADLANPFSNSGEAGLHFINADLTTYLGRLPEGEWIGLEVAGRTSADGVAVANCTLYDTNGPIGHAAVGAVANEPFTGSVDAGG
ncbi:MAG TPA: thioesterase family protein [Acidimicrobiales bacterium]|nr:thioesterase family protein [Acidimicrobiales bacterium]